MIFTLKLGISEPVTRANVFIKEDKMLSFYEKYGYSYYSF